MKTEKKNEYKWIEQTLGELDLDTFFDRSSKRRGPISVFKQNIVTDERLADLSDNDWACLIVEIGTRNEMKKRWKRKRINEMMIKMDSDKTESDKVRQWLIGIGFEMYLDVFLQNGLDSIDVIKQIDTKHELKSIGAPLIGHQIKLLD